MATVFQFPYRTVVEISIPALLKNLHLLRGACRMEVIPVVKADAYGHGMVMISKALVKRGGCQMCAVATLEEGMELRKAMSHSAQILVLSGFMPHQLDAYLKYRLIPVVHHLGHLKALSDRRNLPELHLKIDSGMHRLGLLPDEVPEAARLLEKMGQKLAGIASHFAESENPLSGFSDKQGQLFEEAVQVFREQRLLQTDARIHVANSGGILRTKCGSSNAVRSGIALYGISPNPRLARADDLLPILKWKARVLYTKRIPKGGTIGYGRTYRAKREETVALVNIGYADGFPRLLSNRGHVLIHGRRAPVRGIVSMDMIAVGVHHIPGVKEGSLVTLLGESGREKIDAWDVAHWAQTIPYEILCGISPRVPKLYVD